MNQEMNDILQIYHSLLIYSCFNANIALYTVHTVEMIKTHRVLDTFNCLLRNTYRLYVLRSDGHYLTHLVRESGCLRRCERPFRALVI